MLLYIRCINKKKKINAHYNQGKVLNKNTIYLKMFPWFCGSQLISNTLLLREITMIEKKKVVTKWFCAHNIHHMLRKTIMRLKNFGI